MSNFIFQSLLKKQESLEFIPFEINVASAEGLPKPKQNVYALVSINGIRRKTRVHKERTKNPHWDFKDLCLIERSDIECGVLMIEVYNKRFFQSDKYICKFQVTLDSLLRKAEEGKTDKVFDALESIDYGKSPLVKLNVSYTFGGIEAPNNGWVCAPKHCFAIDKCNIKICSIC